MTSSVLCGARADAMSRSALSCSRCSSTLGERHAWSPLAIEHLREALRDPDPDAERAAVFIAAEVPALRSEAREALASLAERGDSVARWSICFDAVLGASVPWTRAEEAAITALAAQGHVDAEVAVRHARARAAGDADAATAARIDFIRLVTEQPLATEQWALLPFGLAQEIDSAGDDLVAQIRSLAERLAPDARDLVSGFDGEEESGIRALTSFVRDHGLRGVEHLFGRLLTRAMRRPAKRASDQERFRRALVESQLPGTAAFATFMTGSLARAELLATSHETPSMPDAVLGPGALLAILAQCDQEDLWERSVELRARWDETWRAVSARITTAVSEPSTSAEAVDVTALQWTWEVSLLTSWTAALAARVNAASGPAGREATRLVFMLTHGGLGPLLEQRASGALPAR